MCVKFDGEEDNEILILESTGNLGVHFVKFAGLAKHEGSFFKKIVVRHLKFERTND
jgi:hypothetical protein